MRRMSRDRFLTDAELSRFLGAVSGGGNRGHVALFTLLCSTGIRPSEALSLTHSDLHLSGKTAWIRVSRLKKKKAHPVCDEVAIPATVADALRALEPGAADTRVFAMHRRTAQRTFHAYARTARLPRRLYLYCLRHTAATRIYRKTRDIAVVQALLGHDSPETSCIYAHVTRDILREHADSFPVAL